MKLVDFLHADSIIVDLKAANKRDAAKELVELLGERGRATRTQTKSIVDALMAREKLGSTGIGRGLAVPHATHPGAKALVGALGLSRKGIDFQALDGKPVFLVFLLLYPPAHTDRLQALKLLSQFAKHSDLCRFLKQAPDAKTAFELLEEADTKLHEVG